jgi:glycosyltransferase involved in cell wall biosynthesis
MILNKKFAPALVSAIIPVYNRSTLLQEAVNSVLSQTYPHIEIIIVDDGSTDETAGVCDQLAMNHDVIKIIHQAHDGRPGMVREAGRRIAQGEYIQYLDSDDILQAKKFEIMTKALADHPDCDIAYCYTRRYQRGETALDVPCERTGETFDKMLPEFVKQRFWHTCTPLYTRRLCDRAGAWSDLQFWEDVEYDMRIAAMGPRLYHCKEFLADFRDHGFQRLSKSDFFADAGSMRHAPKAYCMIYEIVKNCGISLEDENVQCFLNEVRSIADNCATLGLNKEAAQCLKIIEDANGKSEMERSQSYWKSAWLRRIFANYGR